MGYDNSVMTFLLILCPHFPSDTLLLSRHDICIQYKNKIYVHIHPPSVKLSKWVLTLLELEFEYQIWIWITEKLCFQLSLPNREDPKRVSEGQIQMTVPNKNVLWSEIR